MQIKITAIFLITMLLFACKQEKKLSKSDVIPSDKLIPVLVDLHKADGILSVYRIRKEFATFDKKEIYDNICQKHGTTRDKVNFSIEYYSKDLEKFEQIFEKVIEELNKLEYPAGDTQVEKMVSSTGNLWNQKTNWILPEDGDKNQIIFSIPVKELGKYIIKAKIKLYNDDQSINPKIYAYFWYDNGTIDGFREYFELPLKKTDEFEHCVISKSLRDDNVTHLKGWILYDDMQEGSWKKHAEVTDISVEFIKDKRK